MITFSKNINFNIQSSLCLIVKNILLKLFTFYAQAHNFNILFLVTSSTKYKPWASDESFVVPYIIILFYFCYNIQCNCFIISFFFSFNKFIYIVYSYYQLLLHKWVCGCLCMCVEVCLEACLCVSLESLNEHGILDYVVCKFYEWLQMLSYAWDWVNLIDVKHE